jgi:hypothetical protein
MTDETSPPIDDEAASSAPEPKTAKSGKAGKGQKTSVPNAVWMGTAVGVGSAALVAALMYTKRRK